MNTFLRNTISKLYHTVSAPVAAIREEGLQSLCETISLLNNRMEDNIEYRRQRLKDTIETESRKEGRSL